jgi:TRAP-type C4-dicarboxylate transport system permease small subunit
MTAPRQEIHLAPTGVGFILRVAALVFFILAIIAGYRWGLTNWHWEGLTATGLGLYVGSTLIA